jgi:hypothetical protein
MVQWGFQSLPVLGFLRLMGIAKFAMDCGVWQFDTFA